MSILDDGTRLVVGMTGYAGAGKDTVANVLIEDWGFQRFALADALRESMLALDPVLWTPSPWSENAYRLADAVDRFGWDLAKREQPEIRRLLQVFGTEVGRTLFGENVWIDVLERKIAEQTDPYARIVVTDVRFPNEADWVHELGGFLMRVERPGVGPINNHPSEQRLAGVDYTIHNDSTIEGLRSQVATFLLNERVA